MRRLTAGLAVAAFLTIAAPSVAAPVHFDAQVQALHEPAIAFVKKDGKGGRAWGRSHNRGRHLGWYKQRRR